MSELPTTYHKPIQTEIRRAKKHVFRKAELERTILTPSNCTKWGIPDSVRPQQVIDALINAKFLSLCKLQFPNRTFDRYLLGAPSIYEVVQTINPQGYFSHFTAMHLHNLTDQLPKVIYFNVEQRMAPGGGKLDQEAIDRVFRRPGRISHNTAAYEKLRVTVLNGGNTQNAGVGRLRTREDQAEVRVATIDRTLIDIAVRPAYSGGVFEVARAYRAARQTASVRAIAKLLGEIGYTYPYHQAIGFYLEREGYPDHDVELLRQFPIEYDFYLDYAMRQTEYNARWRLFIPKGF